MKMTEKPSHFHKDRPFYQADEQYYYKNILELITPGSKILDAGCGRGGLMETLKNRGCEVSGFDISPDAIRICDQKGLDVWQDDLDNLQKLSGHYDYCLVIATLEHITDPRHVLKTLKPHCNHIIVAVPNFSLVTWRIYYLMGKNAKKYTTPLERAPFLGIQSDGHLQFFNQPILQHLLEITGYRVEKWNNARWKYDGSNHTGITHKGPFKAIRKLIMNSLPANNLFATLLIVKARSL